VALEDLGVGEPRTVKSGRMDAKDRPRRPACLVVPAHASPFPCLETMIHAPKLQGKDSAAIV
jgi:hypothetical protein